MNNPINISNQFNKLRNYLLMDLIRNNFEFSVRFQLSFWNAFHGVLETIRDSIIMER